MKLVNAAYGVNITFEEGIPEILILEKESIYRKIIGELWSQANGKDGSFTLSNGRMLKFEKETEMIINPFALDFQNRKITSTLISKMTEIGNEMVYEKHALNSEILNILETISNSVNYSGVDYQIEFSWSDLFKLFGVKIESPEDFVETILEYIKVMSQLCGITLMILVDMKKYFTMEELLQVYTTASYNKISLFLIESCEETYLPMEHVTIIDQDLCVIRRQ